MGSGCSEGGTGRAFQESCVASMSPSARSSYRFGFKKKLTGPLGLQLAPCFAQRFD